VADPHDDREDRQQLESLERALALRGGDLAAFLVFDRPSRAAERPGLARTFFAERCVSDKQIQQLSDALWDVGAQVDLFEGDREFVAALARGHHRQTGKALRAAYNGLVYSVGPGAFQPGRKSLIPLLCDSYGFPCVNSDAYACTFTLHKFHSFRVLESIGVDVPRTWQYELEKGWVGGAPSEGTKLIAKSTFESWAVGVGENSVFTMDETSDRRVAEIADQIGQPVTVQEFVRGSEVYVPVLSTPRLVALPPVESRLLRAPEDPEAVVTLEDNLDDDAVVYRPFECEPEVDRRLRHRAREIVDVLHLEGLARIDFRVDEEGCPRVFDIAVSPGFGPRGASFCAAAHHGFDHPSFVRLVFAATLASRGCLAA
jgi:D-alanine-D-alanine ligase